MRVQTYAIWVHRRTVPQNTRTTAHAADQVTGFIDGLIAQMTYYPSFVVQITPDADGLVVGSKQRVIAMDEQHDGMVALRTEGRDLWITHADYQRLLA